MAQMTGRQTKRGVRFVIGKGATQTLTVQEMRQREIMRIAREVLKLERERRKNRKRLKEIAKELRMLRRAQRVVLAPVLAELTDEFESAVSGS